MKNIFSWLGLSISLIVIIVIGISISSVTDNLGSSFDDKTTLTLIGSASNYTSLPIEVSFSNSTTTDSALSDGGDTLQQMLNTGGIRKAILNFAAVGGTATSTMYVRQMGSNDGDNYFDIAPASSTVDIAGTSTIAFIPKAIQFDAGTASSSISVPFEIDGYRYTRFIMYGEDVSTDPNDGVQAWITASLIRDKGDN